MNAAKQHLLRRRFGGLALAVATALLVAPASADAGVKRTAKLRGTEEVPGPGAFEGRGRGRFILRAAQGKVCFALRWRGIQQPVAAHIHRGKRGKRGPIKVTLFEEPAGVPGRTAEGCVERVRKRLIKRIANRPRRYYVNIHNAQFPEGAIRGQLRKPAGRR